MIEEQKNIEKKPIEVSDFPALLGDSLGNVGLDLSEVAIDSVLKEGLLKDIPIVNAIVAFCKVGISIRERNLLNQTIEFINSFNSGTIDKTKLEKYKKEIIDNPDKAEKELGRCLLIMNSTIEKVQSRILGRLFKSYVSGTISWDKFVELSAATQRLFVEDIKHLKEIYRNPNVHISANTKNAYNYFRLQSLGFLTSATAFNNFNNMLNLIGDDLDTNAFTISQFGKTFIEKGGLMDITVD